MGRRAHAVVGLLSLACLSGCASPLFDVGRTELVLPLHRAWFEGRAVDYVVTDISEPTMAASMGANFVPRLADALPVAGRRSLVDKVYKFAGNEQPGIFPSSPTPPGAGNTDRQYSPLWQVVMVHWRRPDRVRELRSEEALLAAEESGAVALVPTGTVINCPVVRDAAQGALPGVR